MSPTSYQAAPPRKIILAESTRAVKSAKTEGENASGFLLNNSMPRTQNYLL
jgi:hypothetical protein